MKFSAHILTIISIVSFSGCLPAVPEAPETADTMTTSLTTETGSTTNTDNDCWAVAIDDDISSALVGSMTEVPRSVEFWVYLQDTPVIDFPYFTLMGPENISDDGLRLRLISVASETYVSVLMSLPDGQGVFTDLTKSAKEWHHIAMENDGNEQWSLYFDGQRSHGTTHEMEPQYEMVWTDGLRLGNRQCGGGETCVLRMMLDEVRFSKETRYSKTSAFKPSTHFEIDKETVGLWHFDDGKGAMAMNSVDGGVSFSLEGNATWTKSTLCE